MSKTLITGRRVKLNLSDVREGIVEGTFLGFIKDDYGHPLAVVIPDTTKRKRIRATGQKLTGRELTTVHPSRVQPLDR